PFHYRLPTQKEVEKQGRNSKFQESILQGALAKIMNAVPDVTLFEKRKFILRTDYLLPIKEGPRQLWKEVLANKPQLSAWKTLFAIDPRKVNEQFLKEHPTLVVDTSHLGQDFKDRLLAAFEDLDEATDGLLIHAENYQALRLLQRKYAGKVKCIYIDPPYNTGSDEFIYKDRYRHSSWLSMVVERSAYPWKRAPVCSIWGPWSTRLSTGSRFSPNTGLAWRLWILWRPSTSSMACT
ncbi:MAG: hypothetical protein HY725_00915, partial [Candidatus Rokubacteria bacterium]|nr:hypothetical protein [Candidatus Rokubacteria bacterium]